MTLLQFDEYEVDLDHRRLTESGRPLRLGGRAFDILSALISRAGVVVTKEELIDLVWPTTTVDEGSLRVHLVALRKTLGDQAKHYIETIPGRGYLFAGIVRQSVRGGMTLQQEVSLDSDVPLSLPRVPKRLIGRDDFIRSSLDLLKTARLLTFVGPGGIGKTSVAVVCAQNLALRKRVAFIDLAAISEGDKLLPTLAAQLGLNAFGEDVLPGILVELSKTETLLVLDSCERIVDAVANSSEALLRGSPTTQILATSREPLRSSMERVRQLPPLEFPRDGEEISGTDAYPAVELFALLAALSGENIDMTERSSLELAADIVRRLDGIPLAIELAAARTFDMDLQTLHRSVADPISLLRRGRRTAPPRQQTLRATLDWSFATLSELEKEILLRLSVFAGSFSPEAAMAVAGVGLPEESFHEAFDGLFLKSLVVVTRHGGSFRLLGTTRDYAGQKLKVAEFARACKRAHALYCNKRLEETSREWPTTEPSKWRADNEGILNDLRSALIWAFGEDGDEMLGIELSASSNTLWVQLGLIAEQLEISERALRLFERRSVRNPDLEMKLRMSYGSALYHTETFERNVEVMSEYRRVLQLAKDVANTNKVMRAIVGIAAIHTSNGDYQDAIDLVHSFDEEFDACMPQARSRILNHNYHYIGDFNNAMHHASIALSPQPGLGVTPPNSGSSYDPRVSALCTVVKTLWIQGRYSDAKTALIETLDEALAQDHAISTCLYLAVSACPTAFGMGDFALGGRLLEILGEVSTKNSLLRWSEWSSCYATVLRAVETDDALLFDRMVDKAKGTLFENCLIIDGRLANAETLDRVIPEGNWCGAEVLRLRGELMMNNSPLEGQALLFRGYELAGRQSAATFQIRCAASLLRNSSPNQVTLSLARLSQALGSVEQDESVEDIAVANALLKRFS